MRRLKINLMDLEEAFESNSPEMHYYLDTETGEVLMVTDDSRQELERLREEAGPEDKLEDLLRDSELPDWQKQALAEAQRVEEDYGTRVVEVPEPDAHDGLSRHGGIRHHRAGAAVARRTPAGAPRARRLSPVQGRAGRQLSRAGTLVPIQARALAQAHDGLAGLARHRAGVGRTAATAAPAAGARPTARSSASLRAVRLAPARA